jgi:hypothetical protein
MQVTRSRPTRADLSQSYLILRDSDNNELSLSRQVCKTEGRGLSCGFGASKCRAISVLISLLPALLIRNSVAHLSLYWYCVKVPFGTKGIETKIHPSPAGHEILLVSGRLIVPSGAKYEEFLRFG